MAYNQHCVLAAVTHGGGLSGLPSDLSFRCLSALVRVDFTISSWVMFNSGCCWMYSRIVPYIIANKTLTLKKDGSYVIVEAMPQSPKSHLVQFPLLQRLGDPFESLLVRQLRPLFTKTVLNVFGGRLVSDKGN